MLNATNRTLSANTNRLNLGTRNLASFAGFNYGMTLRSRWHDSSRHSVDVVRAEVRHVASSPSIRPIPPKPIGGKSGFVGRKRGSDLGSSLPSSSASSRSTVATRAQGLSSFLGFHAFDLSTAAFKARSTSPVMRPRAVAHPGPLAVQAQACSARATQPASSYARAYEVGSEHRHLEPSASS